MKKWILDRLALILGFTLREEALEERLVRHGHQRVNTWTTAGVVFDPRVWR